MPQLKPSRDRPTAHCQPNGVASGSHLILITLPLLLTGCSSLLPGSESADRDARLQELMKVPTAPEYIREATVPFGMHPIEVEGVGAVNALPGTGGPADPSPYRDQLLKEMKSHDVIDPNHFLEDTSTALVRVRATIAPGARRGDPVDLRVLAPAESRVGNLHHGWLLDTRLRQQQVVQNTIRQSEVMAIGVGPILTRGSYSPGDDAAMKTEGNVLAGGRVQVDRQLGIGLHPDYQHAKMSKLIAEAINKRFFFFDGTTRRGIAKPLEDDFIELDVHPRYRDNIARMMQVVRSIAASPSTDTQSRLTELSEQLRDPATAADAALKLEAMGESAVPTLIDALTLENPELRFYAAEALAYLERVEAIEPLEKAATHEPAFRYLSLLALQGIENQLAVDALLRLIDQPSLETRYGAFCSIRRRTDGREVLGGVPSGPFWMYRLPSAASSAVIVSLRESPEVVLLGSPEPLQIDKFIRSGGLIVKADPEAADPSTALRVSHFQPDVEDRKTHCGADVESLLTAIVKVGGNYGDVVAVLRKAKEQGSLKSQLAIDPIPRPLRTYHREEERAEETADE